MELKKIKCILFVLIISSSFVYSDEYDKDTNYIKTAVKQYYNETYGASYGTNWTYGRSSELKNIGDYNFKYENLFDGSRESAWCESGNNSGINEFLLFNIRELDEFGFYSGFNYNSAVENGIEIYFSVFNGLCSSDEDYHKFNRVKKALIQFYEVPKIVGQNNIKIEHEPIVLSYKTIELADISIEQIFNFHIEIEKENYTSTPDIIMKFTILDVYPGTDYDNTCISEIKVYGEYAE